MIMAFNLTSPLLFVLRQLSAGEPLVDHPFARISNLHPCGRSLVAPDSPRDEVEIVCGTPSGLPHRPKRIHNTQHHFVDTGKGTLLTNWK